MEPSIFGSPFWVERRESERLVEVKEEWREVLKGMGMGEDGRHWGKEHKW
jgi:hypothetical protein